MTSAGGMLVAAPERWDEACFAVPALRAIVATGLPTGVLCRAEQRDFWRTVEGVAVVDFPENAKAKQIAALVQNGWAASLVWESGATADAFKIAGISRRLGPSGGKLGKLLTHPLAFAAGPLEHRVRYYLAAVEELGMATARPEFLVLATKSEGEAVLLCPDSDFGANHEWPLERWVEIAEKLVADGRSITVGTATEGRGLGNALAGKCSGQAEIVALSPLSDVLPKLSGHALVIAADGSLPHLAGHAGGTCVVLFGPNDPAWKRPLGKRHTVVRRHVECAPCLLPKCPLDLRCQRQLDVERVWQAICGTHPES